MTRKKPRRQVEVIRWAQVPPSQRDQTIAPRLQGGLSPHTRILRVQEPCCQLSACSAVRRQYYMAESMGLRSRSMLSSTRDDLPRPVLVAAAPRQAPPAPRAPVAEMEPPQPDPAYARFRLLELD